MENGETIVSVCCMSYNHAAYIRQCLDGFLMQKCDFTMEIIVHDDASTDNTQEIIREYERHYPNMFRNILQKENQRSKEFGRVTRFLLGAARGKYIALCEGDDYWTDPEKLQKQVDFLETNEACSMVFTGCEVNKMRGERKTYSYPSISTITPDDYLTKNYFMTTASLLFRRKVLDIESEQWMTKAFAGDFVLRYKSLSIGDIGHVPDITCVYNKGTAGSWSKRRITREVAFKEFSDNLRGLYFLIKHRDVRTSSKNLKVARLKQGFLLNYAMSMPILNGLLLLSPCYKFSLFSLRNLIYFIKQKLGS